MSTSTEFQQLSTDITRTFGVSVVFSRETGGSFSFATGTETGQSTTTLTMNATEEKKKQYTTSGPDGSSLIIDEVVYLVDRVTFYATLGYPKQGDTATSDGKTMRVVGHDLEAHGKMFKITCRNEKKK